MHIAVVPVWGIIFNVFLTCVAANLTLGFKVTKISANNKPANCNVANTTYAHGETFKLDCKTQCVCENGRHACSSLCPKEQLPAPEDTISCRSPRLVEVPGHCCKMWLCENPTADVYATCHNSSTSPWTPCSRICGLGISTRFTTTTAGCNQLSNLRLCENRKCDNIDGDNAEEQEDVGGVTERGVAEKENQKYLIKSKQMKNKLRRQHEQQHHKHDKHRQEHGEHTEHEHRIRKGHECRSIQRLGPARIRLGECVSKKLYRPKICGRCHYNTKCCVPSLSTTIQVELLCPLNAIDPISFVQQQLTTRQRQPQQQQQQQHQPYYAASSLTSLWDTHSLDAIDQEYLQSHQIQIANKFIAVEWILKCECTKKDNCQRIVNTTMSSSSSSSSSNRNRNSNENDHENNENLNNNKNVQNYNYFKLNYKQQQQHHTRQQHINNTPHNDKDDDDNENDNANDNDNDDDEADNDSDTNINNINSHKKQTKDYYATNTNKNNYNYNYNNKNNIRNYKELVEQEANREEEEWTTSSSLSSSYDGDVATTSDEIQPDIIPYPPPPFSANKQTHNQNNNNSGNKKNKQTAKKINEKFKLEHNKQQQQYYEQWLLQQYQPYQQEQEKEEQRPETLAT